MSFPDNERRMLPIRRDADKWNKWDRRIRDIGIYIVAIAGTINQLFFTKDQSETALVFLAAMLGFPLILKADEARRFLNNEDSRERYYEERGSNGKSLGT